MKTLLYFIVIISIISCKTESDKFLGHWHSTPFARGTYATLDITDSLIVLNRLSVNGIKGEFKRTEKEVFLDPFRGVPTKDFQIFHDTLIINDEYTFVRPKEHLKMNDYFSHSLVSINLKRATSNSITEEDLVNKKFSPILVGPRKMTVSDSVYLHVNDIFIENKHLKEYAEMELDRWPKSNYNMVIHADSTVSYSYIKDIINFLEPLEFIDNILISRYNYELDRMEFDKVMANNFE